MSLYGNYPNPELCRKYGCWKQARNLNGFNDMGCEGCTSSLKGQDQDLANIKVTAKKWAIDNGQNVFIYKNESGDWAYMGEAAARSIGIQPTGGILSFLQPVNA